MDTYLLEIKCKDNLTYQFNLTIDELMKLSNMPYKIVGSGNPGKQSHVRLDKASCDAYRLGENFHIVYDNEEKRSIYPHKKYSEIETTLKSAISKIIQEKDIDYIIKI